MTFIDNNGDPLTGEHRYEMHFPAGSLPPVDAFWSLTMYALDLNLIDNPIDRYSIGDRSKHLKYGEDGSLTLYLQKDSPGKDKAGNWLPTGDTLFGLPLSLYSAGSYSQDTPSIYPIGSTAASMPQTVLITASSTISAARSGAVQ